MDAFSVLTGAIYLLVFLPSLAQATPPWDRLRGRYASLV
jgi:hypothetical protein